MLAGVHQAKMSLLKVIGHFLVPLLNATNERRNFHEVGPRTGDKEKFDLGGHVEVH
jgi:hypothetical protein